MTLLALLGDAIATDPVAAILTWVLGATAMALVVSDHEAANTTSIVVLAVLWFAVVPVMLVARVIDLLDLPPRRPRD